MYCILCKKSILKNRNKPQTSHLCSIAGVEQTIEQSTSALFNVCSRLVQQRRTRLVQSHSAALLRLHSVVQSSYKRAYKAPPQRIRLFKKCGVCTSYNARTHDRTNDRTNERTNERTKHLRNGFVSYKAVVQARRTRSSYKPVQSRRTMLVQSPYNLVQ